MVERRGARRFFVAEPAGGGLRLLQDVTIGPAADGQLTILTSDPIPRGEQMRLEIPSEDGETPTRLVVRAVECGVVVDHERLQQRVRLQVIRDPVLQTADITRSGSSGRIGALIRRIPIRLVNLSRSGCLCETPVPVQQGTVGFMDVTIGERRHTEAVRLGRLEQRQGRIWPFRVGGEFLTLGAASSGSLRGVASIFSIDEGAALT